MPDLIDSIEAMMNEHNGIIVCDGGVPDQTGELIPWMDERYMFCGQVAYRATLDKDPAVACDGGDLPKARCGLACDGVCAFDDPAFDWERARECHANQPHEWTDYESAEAYEVLRAKRRAGCD